MAAQTIPLDGEPLCGVEGPETPFPTPADDGVLRVAQYNVLHSETDDGDQSLAPRLPLLVDVMVASGADIVGLEEVTRNLELEPADEYPQKHGLVAQRLADLMAQRTGEPWSWCWSLSNPHVPLTPDEFVGGGNPLDQQAAQMGNFPDEGDFSEGLAILSRFPISESVFRRLLPRSYETVGCVDLDPFCPLDAIFDSRQVLFGRVETPGGGLDFFVTHLAHHLTELSTTTQTLQAQQIVGIIDEFVTADTTTPDVLVGDLNSVPGSEAIGAVMAAGYVDAWSAFGGAECVQAGDGGCSGGPPAGEEVWTASPSRAMSERIDYVFVRPPAGCSLRIVDAARIGEASVPDGERGMLWPSDHDGFVVQPACAAAAAAPSSPAAGGVGAGGSVDAGGRLPATGGGALRVWPLLGGLGAWVLTRLVRRRPHGLH